MKLSDVNQKAFVDVPSSSPAVKMPLQRVGISNRPHYIRVLDPFNGEMRDLWAEINVSFFLPAGQRGVHMSRIEQALHAIKSETERTLSAYSDSLADKLTELQKLERCELTIDAQYENTVDKNRSGHASAELLRLHRRVVRGESQLKNTIGLSVPFINACPCTQRWAVREYYNALHTQGRSESEIAALLESAPRQAHTNRGTATVWIESDKVTYQALYEVLDESVPIIRELLKGADEHDVVRSAHKQGQFCEDNIRAISSQILRRFKNELDPSVRVNITVEVDESVHHHNLKAEVSESLGGLAALIESS